jgi:hypothetical protein
MNKLQEAVEKFLQESGRTDGPISVLLEGLEKALKESLSENESKPSFETALENWLDKAQALVSKNRPGITLIVGGGRKYIKIIETGFQTSVFCFIEKETGFVFKAASWNAPAKTPRGNIYTNNLGVTPYGGVYL